MTTSEVAWDGFFKNGTIGSFFGNLMIPFDRGNDGFRKK
jgi:hypothetical protein